MYLKRSDCVPGRVLRGSGLPRTIPLLNKTLAYITSTGSRISSLEPVLLLDVEFEETAWYLKVLTGKGEVGWIWLNPETPGFTLT